VVRMHWSGSRGPSQRPAVSSFLIVALACTTAVAAAAVRARAQQPDSLPDPFPLMRHAPGEASWAATFRLREAESRYANDPKWRNAYCQLRAQSEVWLGNQASALHFFESCDWSWGDSGYVLPPGTRSVDALRIIAAAADTARIVMVNERHHVASDRLLTLRLLPVLWQKGYRYFAAEALDFPDTALNHRAAARIGVTGGYVDEPVFGEIVREARRLGYTLVPYEASHEQETANDSLNSQQRRDHAQAVNLNDRVFRRDPNAKVLVHAGFGHVKEQPAGDWLPMAWYLQRLTGLNAVTVDQTVMGEGSSPAKEHPAYRAAFAAGLVRRDAVVLTDSAGRPLPPVRFDGVDLQAVTPPTSYTRGRPDWMTLGGRRRAVDVPVPECAKRPCVVEVRLVSDPDDAVPLDRTEAREATVRLFLPLRDPVRIRLYSPSHEVLRTFDQRR